MLPVGLTNMVAAGGLGSLSSQTQEIIIAGLSEIEMANPSRGDRSQSFFFFFFFYYQPSSAMTKRRGVKADLSAYNTEAFFHFHPFSLLTLVSPELAG